MTRTSGPFAAPLPPRPKSYKRDSISDMAEKLYVRRRDGGCVARHLTGLGVLECQGPLDVDHVRASGGLGMKSATLRNNMVCLCRWHHIAKTEWGKTWRPILTQYLERVEGAE